MTIPITIHDLRTLDAALYRVDFAVCKGAVDLDGTLTPHDPSKTPTNKQLGQLSSMATKLRIAAASIDKYIDGQIAIANPTIEHVGDIKLTSVSMVSSGGHPIIALKESDDKANGESPNK